VMGPVPVEEGLLWAERILEEMGEIPTVKMCALHVQGHLRARLGQFDGAHQAIAEWREQFRELGDDLHYAMAAGCVWDVCSLAEDWKGGERVLREAYESLERMQEKSYLST